MTDKPPTLETEPLKALVEKWRKTQQKSNEILCVTPAYGPWDQCADELAALVPLLERKIEEARREACLETFRDARSYAIRSGVYSEDSLSYFNDNIAALSGHICGNCGADLSKHPTSACAHICPPAALKGE